MCRRKYEFGVYYCDFCQISIIPMPRGAMTRDQLEKAGSLMNSSSIRIVFDADQRRPSELLVVRSLIESSGITCFFLSSNGQVVRGEYSMDPERSGDLRIVHALAVAEEDYEDAKVILDRVLGEIDNIEQ
jgi:hypothetical protein